MSSTLKQFTSRDDFLDNPMITEFRAWIKDSIKWRMEKMGYNPMSEKMNESIVKCLLKHTNAEYLTCANSLTSDLEDVLMDNGINENDAIRLAWKWSD